MIIANLRLVNAACSRAGRMLEPDDRMQSALLGLLYAIRTYRNGSFTDYALRCMQQFIREAEREQREVRRAEAALSLDMKVSWDEGNPCTYLDLCAATGDDYALFDLVDAVKQQKGVPHE